MSPGVCQGRWGEEEEEEELPSPVVPSPHVAWEQPEIPVLILSLPDPKPGGFLPEHTGGACPLCTSAGIPQHPAALTTLPNSRAHSQ